MLLPAIIYIFIFCYVPMYGVQLAFRGYDFKAGIYGGKWVGFKYFKQYFDSAMVELTDFKERVIKRKYSIVKWLRDLKECKCKYYIGKNDFKPVVMMLLSRIKS